MAGASYRGSLDGGIEQGSRDFEHWDPLKSPGGESDLVYGERESAVLLFGLHLSGKGITTVEVGGR